ncbi:MAG: VCBS repeat-containing protein [Chitinophagaceae bacterium]|nr:VCBS repeat-containing protein [Chitinophagaceae bacterium]
MPSYVFFHLLLPLFFSAQPVFEEQVIDNNISIGYGLALGDVDGDGKPDILLADKKQFVWYRNGDWKKFVMAENLTEHDNVCIAAKDINGDGKVEVAVGAQWNPSETGNDQQSGAVFYLVRPADPTQLWKPVQLHHEPTTHRMRWMQAENGKYYLAVLPLHGRGNQGGNGAGVQFFAYEFPKDVLAQWKLHLIDSSLHLTHNFDIPVASSRKGLYMASKEGVKLIDKNLSAKKAVLLSLPGIRGAGEVRVGKLSSAADFIATVEPMHGQEIVVYTDNGKNERILLDDNVKEGHALATGDFSGVGRDQLVSGWRSPNKDGKVGVKLYTPTDASGASWQQQWIDENGMACEDLQVMDMNGDGKPDIVAAGRATKNVKIYWNKSGR